MMAYAAVVSLKQTIDRLLNSSPHISSFVPPSSDILISAHKQAESLTQVLEALDCSSKYSFKDLDKESDRATKHAYLKKKRVEALEVFESYLSDQFPSEYQILQYWHKNAESWQELDKCFRERVDASDGRIKEAVRRLQDVLEPLVSKFKEEPMPSVSAELEQLEQVINSFTQTVKEYLHSKKNEDGNGSGNKTKMVQSWDAFPKTLCLIIEIRCFADTTVFLKMEAVIQMFGMNRSSRSSERLNALDGKMREAAYKLEDVLESHVSNQYLSLSETESHQSLFSLDLQEAKQYVDSFTQSVKKLKEEYINELCNPLTQGDDVDDVFSSRIGFSENKSKLVGLSKELSEIKGFTSRLWGRSLRVYSLFGMAGIGKTALVREVFEDPSTLRHFKCLAWVNVGPKYQLTKVLQSIMVQVNPSTSKIFREGDAKLADLKRVTSESLKGRKFLIVLDDVWINKVWDDLKGLLPEDYVGSRVLLTSRQHEVARSFSHGDALEMRFLNEEESWDLLREKVFGEERCPFQLAKAGKKIAKNCEGLPLSIVTVARFLSKAEKTPEFWHEVAEKENSVFNDANEEMSEVLITSYDNLPQYLKPCFLYMGVFPQIYDIPHSKLIKLWTAEGFLEPKMFQTIEDHAVQCLNELDSRSLVMIRQKSNTRSACSDEGSSYDRIKTCGLHSAFWHLCVREAGKNKFFHVLSKLVHGLAEGIKSQRRMCIHNNVLFGIKDVYESMESIATARSLLCTGPSHPYPVPLCLGSKLLRLLDATSIRFYQFPTQVVKLLQLRFLALTCNQEIPISISNLLNLECLIVNQHLRIKSSGAPAYLPVEIWDMKKLKHIQVMGRDLPDPRGKKLPTLLTLLDVSACSCTKGVFQGLPILKKLGIQIELAPHAVESSSHCFDYISLLSELVSLKCVIVNPILSSEVVAPTPPLPVFPSSLVKLTLSGFGYPWEEMSKIASLPNLRVLKLRCYAFRGPRWDLNGFKSLRILLIEDSDLRHWTIEDDDSFRFGHLTLKHCYKLERTPLESGEFAGKIEMAYCNPLAMSCVKQKMDIGLSDVQLIFTG